MVETRAGAFGEDGLIQRRYMAGVCGEKDWLVCEYIMKEDAMGWGLIFEGSEGILCALMGSRASSASIENVGNQISSPGAIKVHFCVIPENECSLLSCLYTKTPIRLYIYIYVSESSYTNHSFSSLPRAVYLRSCTNNIFFVSG